MRYRLSQLVNNPSRIESSEPQPSAPDSPSGDACIDLEKSSVSIIIGLPQKKRPRRQMTPPKTKIAPFYKGQPIELSMEIHLKRPIAEGSSLVFFSPFLTADGAGTDPAPGRRRLWRVIRNLTRWRPHSNRVFSLPAAMAGSDAQAVYFESIDFKSDAGAAINSANPAPSTKRVKPTVAAPMLFRFCAIDENSGAKKVMPLIMETAMLNPSNPHEPVLRLSLKEKEKSISHLGVRLPEEYWQSMIFLYCKPPYVVFSIDADDKATEIIETVTIYRSDGGAVKMSATVEKQIHPYMELEFIAPNMCRIRLVVRAAGEALKTSGKPRLITNLSFADGFSNQILKFHLPVKIAFANAGETAAPKA